MNGKIVNSKVREARARKIPKLRSSRAAGTTVAHEGGARGAGPRPDARTIPRGGRVDLKETAVESTMA